MHLFDAVFIWQVELIQGSTGNLTLVECTTYSFIVFDDFPVAIHWVFCLSASIVNYTFPHLKPENGECHDEKRVKDENVAELTHGQK